MDRDSLVIEYGRELKMLRGVTDNTVSAYTKGMMSFFRWLGERDFMSVTREDFLQWRESESPRRKPAGLQLCVAAVRSFYAWLTETQRIARNPCPDIVVRKTHEDPDVPTSGDFLRMREAIQYDKVTSTLVELLAGSGLRIDAALSLRREQLLLSDPSVGTPDWRRRETSRPLVSPPTRPTDYVQMDPLHSKSKRAVRVPITPCAADAMRRWIRPNCGPQDPVFQISYASAYRRVRNAGRAVGIDISPHSLRHYYACVMYYRNLDGNPNDSVWVRDAMCHSSIQVTDVYLKLSRFVIENEFDWHAVVWHWQPNQKRESA